MTHEKYQQHKVGKVKNIPENIYNISRPATHKNIKQRKSTRAMQTVFEHEKAYTCTQENREKEIRTTNDSKKMCALRVPYDVFLFIRRVCDVKSDEQ